VSEHWFIAGANRGIGLELVRQLAARGDRVTASVRDEASRAALATRLAPQHAAADILCFDMRDAGAMRAAAERVAGPIDVIVANAGVAGLSPQNPLALDFEAALDAFSINALGPLRLVRAFRDKMAGSKNPRIGLMSSRLGSTEDVRPTSAVYAASKAALNKFAQCLAEELKPEGVAVVALHPGWVRTDMGGANAPLSPEESAAGLLATLDAFELSETGAFLDYRSQALAW
jgi:NAD(P)-dependent dehydrogenase (short-subunit alcohol dehydrogenase family)